VNLYTEDMGPNETEIYPLRGIDEKFVNASEMTFYEIADEYDSEEEVCQAILNDSSLAVVDKSVAPENIAGPIDTVFTVEIGESVYAIDLLNKSNYINLTIIGILDEMYTLPGVFVSKDTVQHQFRGYDNVYFMRIEDEDKAKEASNALEYEFIDKGLQAIVVKEAIDEFLQVQNQIMLLFRTFLGMGLIVGIAGLAVVTIRAVSERRQQIGVMRAIGYKKSMIFKNFIIETSYIAILGIIIGFTLGIGLSYNVYSDQFSDSVAFTIPWWEIMQMIFMGYILTLLFTILPARSAAKLPPAEALRYE